MDVLIFPDTEILKQFNTSSNSRISYFNNKEGIMYYIPRDVFTTLWNIYDGALRENS